MEGFSTILENESDSKLQQFIDEREMLSFGLLDELEDEIYKRDYNEEQKKLIDDEIKYREDKFKELANTKFKKELKFGWRPYSQKVFNVEIEPDLLRWLVVRTFIILGWELVFENEGIFEAKRYNGEDQQTEKIIITKNIYNRVEILSRSLNKFVSDFGANSIRIKEFLLIFNGLLKQKEGKLEELKEEIFKKDNESKYTPPETLPLPNLSNSNSLFSKSLDVFVAIIVGILFGLAGNIRYIFILYEILIGVFIGYSFWLISKISGFYSKAGSIYFMVLLSFITIIFSKFINYLYSPEKIDFISYLVLRAKQGIVFEGKNFGAIGMIFYWLIQIAIVFYTFFRIRAKLVLKYIEAKVPFEVVEYCFFLFNQTDNIEKVKTELAKKGWKEEHEIELVFTACGIFADEQQINRKG